MFIKIINPFIAANNREMRFLQKRNSIMAQFVFKIILYTLQLFNIIS